MARNPFADEKFSNSRLQGEIQCLIIQKQAFLMKLEHHILQHSRYPEQKPQPALVHKPATRPPKRTKESVTHETAGQCLETCIESNERKYVQDKKVRENE
eukprot:PhF_6_TR3326/c0_g1_i3/m.4696